MEQIFGKGVSKGVAAGPISFYRRPSGEIPRRSVTDTAAELVRFHDACETAKEQLGVLHDKALAEAGEDAAMLFEAHQMMLDDLDFVESIEGTHRKRPSECGSRRQRHRRTVRGDVCRDGRQLHAGACGGYSGYFRRA